MLDNEHRELLSIVDEAASDGSLLRRFQDGSQDAATALYLRYAGRLRTLVEQRCSAQLSQRVDPEDIVQSVFRSFFQRASGGHYEIPPGEELWRLLLVIALNKLRKQEDFHRTDKRNLSKTQEFSPQVEHLCSHSESDETAYQLLQLTIDEALTKMPAHYRAMMELRLQGHEIGEISQQIGRSKRSVERGLQEVRVRLHVLLERENDE